MGKTLSKKYYAKTHVRVLLIGLTEAGKTTMLFRLKLGEVATTIPTIGYDFQILKVGNINVQAWDTGLRGGSRMIMRSWFRGTDGVIFVVDSSDMNRMDETKEYLNEILEEDALKGVPILVMANKQDCFNARSHEVIADELEVRNIIDRQWKIMPCSAIEGIGLEEGLEWLVGVITRNMVQKDVTQSLITSVNDVTKTAEHVQQKTRVIQKGLEWLQSLIGCKTEAGQTEGTTVGLPS